MAREEGRVQLSPRETERLRLVEMLQALGQTVGAMMDYEDKDGFMSVLSDAFDEGFKYAESQEVTQ